MYLQDNHPPQWIHRGWTVTLDTTSNSKAPRYWLSGPGGTDEGCCDSLADAQAEIDAQR